MEVDGSDEFPFQTRDFLVLLEVSFRGGGGTQNALRCSFTQDLIL